MPTIARTVAIPTRTRGQPRMRSASSPAHAMPSSLLGDISPCGRWDDGPAKIMAAEPPRTPRNDPLHRIAGLGTRAAARAVRPFADVILDGPELERLLDD